MKLIALIPTLALLTLACAPLAAQEEAATTLADSPEKALLQRSLHFISTLPAFTAEVNMKFELADKSGATRDGELTGKLAFAGDDRARFRVETPDGAMELYYSPESKLIFVEQQNKYLDGAPFTDRQRSFTLMPSREFGPAQVLLSDFFHGDAALIQSIEELTRLASEDTSPDAPDRLQAKGDGLTTEFWLRKGDEPLLEKFTVDLSQMVAEANPDLTKVLVTYTFSNWNTSPELADDHFTFVIPEGAEKLASGDGGGGAEDLDGKAAPPITLPMLNGDATLDLAAHKGKNVVILDFWASWCGPCRMGLPIVSEVAEQFKDKNVVFYAVNIGESADQAAAFLEQTGFDLPVAMDTERDAQRKYQANSIPRTVIIDKEGIVREVHAGVSPRLKDELVRTLTALTE